MLTVHHLTKKFGGRAVVDTLNIHLERGELYGFLGPNGAGKTTTIKMITGLLRPDGGSVSINGFDIVKQTLDAKKSFGFIPDQPFLYDRLTPREFLRFIGGLYDIPPRECDNRISQWLERFDMIHFQYELIGAFSHGMRQKVSLIAALLHQPPLLVIDEPMVGLDPKSAVVLKDVLKERCSHGTTVFVSTHSMDVAEQLSHRIGIIHNGKLVAEGSMNELRNLVKRNDENLEQIFLEITENQASQPETLLSGARIQ